VPGCGGPVAASGSAVSPELEVVGIRWCDGSVTVGGSPISPELGAIAMPGCGGSVAAVGSAGSPELGAFFLHRRSELVSIGRIAKPAATRPVELRVGDRPLPIIGSTKAQEPRPSILFGRDGSVAVIRFARSPGLESRGMRSDGPVVVVGPTRPPGLESILVQSDRSVSPVRFAWTSELESRKLPERGGPVPAGRTTRAQNPEDV
jgi:hypothetical protein